MQAQLGGKAAAWTGYADPPPFSARSLLLEAAALREMTHPRAIWSLLFPCRDLLPTWGLSSVLPGLNTSSLMTPDFGSQPCLL